MARRKVRVWKSRRVARERRMGPMIGRARRSKGEERRRGGFGK